MRTSVTVTAAIAIVLAVFGTPLSVSAQARRPLEGLVLAQQQAVPAPTTQVRRLTADEAVRLAAENNLGIQIARYDPQIEDLNVAAARAGWTPTFNSSFQQNRREQVPNTLLSGAQDSLRNSQFSTSTGVAQLLPWGGSYSIGWDSARSTTNSFFSSFNPQLNSSLSLNYTQPLLRGFSIDNVRQQLLISTKNREIADVALRETLTATERTVRNAYWELAFAIASLAVQRQSLELAEESLRNTRSRVEIGTTPPIDIVEAEAEVAQRQEAVILAEAQIQTSEDTLRALVFNPSSPDFWTIRIEPTDLPPFAPVAVDVDAAVKNALGRRTDLDQSRKSLEANDVSIRFFRNQTLPDVSAEFNYGLSAIGGTQFQRGPSLGLTPGAIIGETHRSYTSVLSDLLTNDFPTWTAALSISYPIGTSQQEANLARARLQQTQTQTQIRNQELLVATQVRQAARNVLTNQQRVQTTRASRELAERRLEAEQRKFAAGTSTSFIVFQVQRDLAQARNNELRAILDYNRSLVDLETVQEVPLR
jgi:HAE1 family hydrophobic/amphiphilic exporter-1